MIRFALWLLALLVATYAIIALAAVAACIYSAHDCRDAGLQNGLSEALAVVLALLIAAAKRPPGDDE